MLSMSAAALAQTAGESLVTANGTSTLPRRPDLMRLRVELSAEGKTMKDALAQMAERRKSVKQKLVELGAAENAVEFGDLKENDSGSGAESPRMRAMRMSRGGRAPAPPAAGKPAEKKVRLAVTAKAHWPLKSENADDLMTQIHELQEKIRAADVGESKKLSAEQQEEAEEAEVNFGGEQQAAPGEPMFLFVSTVSPEQRSKALTEAFAKASESAKQLAGAAGKQVGPLRQLSVASAPVYDETTNWQRYQGYFGMMQENSMGNEINEVVSPTVGGLSYRVVVTAAFALK
jgi:uncharacterized protein YggE